MNDLLVTSLATLLAAITAYVGGLKREQRRSSSAVSIEQLVSDSVTKHYQQLVREVEQLRAEVAMLTRDVHDRDARIDELIQDKKLAQNLIAGLEQEVAELRQRLGGA